MSDATIFEPAGDRPREESRRVRYQSHSFAERITNVATPQGQHPMLNAMLTTARERNCYYCPLRAGRSRMRRMTFSPDEMAGAFETLYNRKEVPKGLK